MPKLTEDYVQRATYSPKGKRSDFRRDTSPDAPAGFYLRILPTGTRSFILRRTTKQGRRRVWNFPYPEFDVTSAKEAAAEIARELIVGGDPDAVAASAKGLRTQVTLGQVKEALDVSRANLSPYTKKSDRTTWNRVEKVLPLDRSIGTYTSAELRSALQRISSTSIRVQAQNLLKHAYTLAVKRNWTPENPAADLGFAHKKRARMGFLGKDDLGRLAVALEQCTPNQAELILLILYLGLRRGEAVSMDWADIDFSEEKVVFTEHKTVELSGAKELPLNGPALDILKRRWIRSGRPEAGPVLPYTGEGAYSVWRKVRKRGGLEQYSLHDLRRTFAVEARRIGLALQEASVLLGHNNTAVTERHYAHPITEEHRGPSEQVARSLEGRLTIRP